MTYLKLIKIKINLNYCKNDKEYKQNRNIL